MQTSRGPSAVDTHAGYVSVAEITIDAPASAVWAHVMDFGSWIYDYRFEHISGPEDGEGEVEYLWAADAEGVKPVLANERTAENATVLKTLATIPGRFWYGVNTPAGKDGMQSTGVNLVLLTEKAGKTLVTAIRSKEAICPNEQARDAEQNRMTQYQPIAQARWTQKYLPRLKELAEQSR